MKYDDIANKILKAVIEVQQRSITGDLMVLPLNLF